MNKAKDIPKLPPRSTTKPLKTEQKPLSPADETKPSEEKLPQGQIGESVTPEIKANTAELDVDKDPNLGMSDLKKP